MRDVVNRESGLFTSPDDNRRLLNLITEDGKSLNRLCFVCIFVVNVSFFIALIPLSYIETVNAKLYGEYLLSLARIKQRIPVVNTS